MSDLSTSVSVNFSPDGGSSDGSSSGGLSLSRINVTVGPDGVAAKLVDRVQTGTLMLFASAGTVSIVGSYTETIREKMEPLSGVEYIDTPFMESLDFVLAIDEQGNQFIPVVTNLMGGKRKKLNKKTWGILKRGSYTQPWKLLKYKPDIVSGDSALLVNYGSIAAYKAQNIATLDMEPLPTTDNDDAEVYRITSKMVVNEEGEWEYPTGWPAEAEYPGGNTSQGKPDPGTGVVPLRVHEICTMNQNGYASVVRYPIKTARPFIGVSGYSPVKVIVQGDLTKVPEAYQSRAASIYAARSGQPL